jgi:hypothetical protein
MLRQGRCKRRAACGSLFRILIIEKKPLQTAQNGDFFRKRCRFAAQRAFKMAPARNRRPVVDIFLICKGSLFERVEIAGPRFLNFYLFSAVLH